MNILSFSISRIGSKWGERKIKQHNGQPCDQIKNWKNIDECPFEAIKKIEKEIDDNTDNT
jgi:hypothetical protein